LKKINKLKNTSFLFNSEFTEEKLEQFRIKQRKINKCEQILREAFFNAMFIWVLMVVCYANRNQMSYNYKYQIEKLFSGYKNVNLIKIFTAKLLKEFILNKLFIKVNDVQDFWHWTSHTFLSSLKADQSMYNHSKRQTYRRFDIFLNDATSVLIGYPIMRQLRVKNGICLALLYTEWISFNPYYLLFNPYGDLV